MAAGYTSMRSQPQGCPAATKHPAARPNTPEQPLLYPESAPKLETLSRPAAYIYILIIKARWQGII